MNAAYRVIKIYGVSPPRQRNLQILIGNRMRADVFEWIRGVLKYKRTILRVQYSTKLDGSESGSKTSSDRRKVQYSTKLDGSERRTMECNRCLGGNRGKVFPSSCTWMGHCRDRQILVKYIKSKIKINIDFVCTKC